MNELMRCARRENQTFDRTIRGDVDNLNAITDALLHAEGLDEHGRERTRRAIKWHASCWTLDRLPRNNDGQRSGHREAIDTRRGTPAGAAAGYGKSGRTPRPKAADRHSS